MNRHRRRLITLPAVAFAACVLYLCALQLHGNFHEVIPGELYRSAQLDDTELAKKIRRYHIRSVINLRGENPGNAWYDQEVSTSRAAGIAHIDFRMSSKHELNFSEAQRLIATMRDAPKPLLIHCRAGADRTGLASAIYLAAIAKRGEWAAEMQLWPIYGHLPLQFNDAMAMNRTFESLEPSFGFYGS